MVIELKPEMEARLAHHAKQQGKRPEDIVVDILGSAFADDPVGKDLYSDQNGWLRDQAGLLQGFDGMTWKQLAHDGHKH